MMPNSCALTNFDIAFDDNVVTDHDIGSEFPAPGEYASVPDDNIFPKCEIRVNKSLCHGIAFSSAYGVDSSVATS
jgi:hypothetical protein